MTYTTELKQEMLRVSRIHHSYRFSDNDGHHTEPWEGCEASACYYPRKLAEKGDSK